MIRILKEQVRFIDQLHAVEISEVSEPLHTGKRLTLKDIDGQISQQKQDPAKGEPDGSWDPMKLTKLSKHGNYVVREGLLKDE